MSPRKKRPSPLKIGKHQIDPGESKFFSLRVGKLYDSTDLSMPVHVIRGKDPGPIVFLSAAIHGDEINGIEIIREVLSVASKQKIRGSLIAVPIVNVFGLNNRSRYLPDRRDLNRAFPGSPKGSLASRMANLFLKEIVSKCTHGIDFHTGAIHRSNYPQIRADLSDKSTYKFAQSFGVPILVNSKVRDGSLREAARKKKVTTLVFEGGQALRFEKNVIKVGKNGCLRALHTIGLLPNYECTTHCDFPIVAQGNQWVRSELGGTMRVHIKLGQEIYKDQKLATVLSPFGKEKILINSPVDGHIIGLNLLPLVTAGDAVINIATNNYMPKKRYEFENDFINN